MTKPPADLQRLNTWLIWRYEAHPASKKPRKMPYYATTNSKRVGGQGGNSDRAQLTTFAEASAAVTTFKADGVGLAILPACGIVAVDFDHCVDEHGTVRPDILDLVADTYAELSPSGRGVRAFFKGALQSRKSFIRDGHAFDVEFFGTSGFVTFTGNVLATCALLGFDDTIADLTPAILALYEQRFAHVGATAPQAGDVDPLMTYEPRLELTLEQMREALAKLDPDMPEPDWVKVGWAIAHETDKSPEGLALWHEWSSGALKVDGAVSKYDADVAEAKWAYFGRNSGTPITFRSVLKMAKDVTAKTVQAEKRKRFEVIPAMEFAARPPPEWIVKNVLPEGELGMVYGESGSGKSFFVLDLVGAVSRGAKWREQLTRTTRVVYVAAEGAGGFRKRVRAYTAYHGVELSNLGVIGDAPNLLQADDVTPLCEALNAYGPVGVVVVDTLAQATAGGNENSGEDMGKALGHCKAIHKATGALVLLVHHSGKDATKGARGWSGIKAACDVEFEITRADTNRCATLTKLKDGEDGTQFGFRLEKVDLGKDSDGEAITSCAVHEAEVVKAMPVKGAWQAALWQSINDFAGLTGDGMDRGALLDEAVRIAEPDAPKEGKDRRKEYARRALRELLGSGLLYEKDSFIFANGDF